MANGEEAKAEVIQGTLDLMVLRGLVRATWGITNRKAWFYAMTAAGRRRLATEKAEWDRMTSIIHTLLHDQG